MWRGSSHELGDATYGTSYGPGVGRSMRCSSYALGALAASEEHIGGPYVASAAAVATAGLTPGNMHRIDTHDAQA
jgi:hypothetical protein